MKIGSALDMDKRLSSYQTACPHRAYRLECSAFVADRRGAERTVMTTFKADHHLNEWFRVDPHVVARVLHSLHRRGA